MEPARSPEEGEEHQHAIDVESLVADIRRRAAAMRGSGAYPADVLGAPFDLDLAGDVSGSPIRLRPERGYSSKRLAGPPITAVKRAAERLVHHVVQDGLDQASVRIERLRADTEDIERRAGERLDDLSRALRAEAERGERREAELREVMERLAGAVEGLRGDIRALERRIEDIEGGERPR